MTEFKIIETEEDYECPNPREKSTILFQVEYVDGKKYGIMDYDSIGGAAAYEQEYGCGLEYIIKELIGPEDVELIEDEWYIIEGFVSYYTQDYYGEVDCDHYIDGVRRATKEDLEKFYGDE